MLEGKLFSAKPLSADEIGRVERRFAELLKDKVHLTPETDASLLGGVRVEVGGRVYDGSLRLQLQEVLKTLQNGEEE